MSNAYQLSCTVSIHYIALLISKLFLLNHSIPEFNEFSKKGRAAVPALHGVISTELYCQKLKVPVQKCADGFLKGGLHHKKKNFLLFQMIL